MCKRARPDTHTVVATLCTRVKGPTEDDWKKLLLLMKFLKSTTPDKLILSIDGLGKLKWWVDASFAVHPDMKSHTGGGLRLGKGMPITLCRKQKLNTRSSTEAELVGTDDCSVLIVWCALFLGAQGYGYESVLLQDNMSNIQLVNNGKRSSSQRTRALNIRYFYLTDLVDRGELTVEYCSTKEMISDYFTKSEQGALFQTNRKLIMGYE